MPNHVHLLVTPAESGAVSLMLQDVGRRYVRTVNDVQGRTGTLWEGRFRSNLVDSETYLLTCHRYIELNPVRAGLVANAADYPWTSHKHYVIGVPNRLLTKHQVYIALGPSEMERRSRFLSLFESSIDEANLARLRTAVNKGWALGSEAFLDRMESIVGRSVRPARRGRPLKDRDSVESPGGQAEMLL